MVAWTICCHSNREHCPLVTPNLIFEHYLSNIIVIIVHGYIWNTGKHTKQSFVCLFCINVKWLPWQQIAVKLQTSYPKLCAWILDSCNGGFYYWIMPCIWLFKLETSFNNHFQWSHSLLSWQLPCFHGNEYPKISPKQIIVSLLTWVPSFINVPCTVFKLYLSMLINYSQFEHFWCHLDCYVPIQLLMTKFPNFCLKLVYVNTCNFGLRRFITKRKTVLGSLLLCLSF